MGTLWNYYDVLYLVDSAGPKGDAFIWRESSFGSYLFEKYLHFLIPDGKTYCMYGALFRQKQATVRDQATNIRS